MTDPNPLVSGGGFKRLSEHGIVTESGILEIQARKLNEAYLKYTNMGIPFVTLKMAMTLDGRIAARDGSSRWITGPEARKYTHLLRASSDAVMVGVGTVLADDPMLTVRDAAGSNPLRVILDSFLRSPLDANVFSDERAVVFTGNHSDDVKLQELNKRGIATWKTESEDGNISLKNVLQKLGERSITSLLCEGGAALATSLLCDRLVDKLYIFIAPKILGKGIDGIKDLGIESLSNAIHLKNREIAELGEDILITGYPDYQKG